MCFLHAINLNMWVFYFSGVPLITNGPTELFGAAAYGLQAEEERRQAKRYDGADAQRRRCPC